MDSNLQLVGRIKATPSASCAAVNYFSASHRSTLLPVHAAFAGDSLQVGQLCLRTASHQGQNVISKSHVHNSGFRAHRKVYRSSAPPEWAGHQSKQTNNVSCKASEGKDRPYSESLASEEMAGASADGEAALEPAEILQPLQRNDNGDAPEMLLVFLPGALTPPAAYLPLVGAIQAASGLRMWVGILSFVGSIATEAEIRKRYDGLKERLKGMGYKNGPGSLVYFAGHSWGAFQGRIPALHLAHGFIQMCSYFDPAAASLKEYPKPVLTIGGEYDGQIPLPVFARAAGEVASGQAQLGKDYLVANKPVVVIEGMNHAQFSHGERNLERGDWVPAISIEMARAKVALVVAAFLAVQSEGKEASAGAGEAMELLRKRVAESEQGMRPFWEACEREKVGWEALQTRLVEVAHSKIELPPFRTEILWHRFHDNFIYSKPWIDSARRTIFAQAMLQKQGKYGLSSTLWIKLKSPEAMQRALDSSSNSRSDSPMTSRDSRPNFAQSNPTGSQPPRSSSAGDEKDEYQSIRPDSQTSAGTPSPETNPFLNRVQALPRAAAEINSQMFSKALKLCNKATRRRYEAHGKKLKFIDDKYDLTSLKWIEADVAFIPCSEHCDTVEVQSPVLVTPVDDIAPRFAGMYYMKVLTVARAMEWIMVDAFR